MVISLLEITSPSNLSRVYTINGLKEFKNVLLRIKQVFNIEKTKEFVRAFEELCMDFDKELSRNNIYSQPWVISHDKFHEGVVFLIDLSKIPEDVYVASLSKRTWINPKDRSEGQISFEVQFYSNKGLIEEFQRVLVIKGGSIYDSPLRV